MHVRLRSHPALSLSLLVAGLGLVGARAASAAPPDRVSVAADTVVHVKLENEVSSRTARVGDPIRATVVDDDRSGFPVGTRVSGRVTEVQHASKDQPGVL